MKYLLDSVILIDHLNGIQEATTFLLRNRDESVVSLITRTEVLAKPSEKEQGPALSLLDELEHLAMTRQDADVAASLRRQGRLKLGDSFQAAQAINRSLKLVTRNTRDFKTPRDAYVLVPYAI